MSESAICSRRGTDMLEKGGKLLMLWVVLFIMI